LRGGHARMGARLAPVAASPKNAVAVRFGVGAAWQRAVPTRPSHHCQRACRLAGELQLQIALEAPRAEADRIWRARRSGRPPLVLPPNRLGASAPGARAGGN